MIIILETKKSVIIFNLRYDFHMYIFVCMTKHCQLSFNLTEIAPAKSKVKYITVAIVLLF
jgi:hypothetical protein